MSEFLICFHIPANTGYAIEPLERVFFDAVISIVGSGDKIHFGYLNYDNGKPRWLEGKTDNYVKLDYNNMTKSESENLINYISNNNIKNVFAFDLCVEAKICKVFRKGGVTKVISYYGAPMSSLNKGIKLSLKRLQVCLALSKPDHFIFESHGMQRTATHGRGIKKKNTSVVHLGINISKFSGRMDSSHAHKTMGIPADRRIIFYAGHMEKRKGVDVIVRAAAELVNNRRRNDVHFLICGNREGEGRVFDDLYRGTAAEERITFGGYRNDLPNLMPGCYAGVIASTGWDSFPRSSLEMAAAGLPLLVSDLPGLNETIDNGTTGLLFTPGDHLDLSGKIEYLLNEPGYRENLSAASVERVKREFTLEIQESNLRKIIKSVIY